MWIRSQDKKVLVNVTDIWIDDNVIKVSNGTTENSFCSIGLYKSSERAMEILNHIQKLLEDVLLEKIHYVPIYDMPLE
jgi:hypothetical protein